MRLIQIYNSDGEEVALYNCSNDALTEEQIKTLILTAEELSIDKDDDAAEQFLSNNDLERVFVDVEIYL